MAKCDCFHQEYGRTVCWGTREKDECSCGGRDFHPAQILRQLLRCQAHIPEGGNDGDLVINIEHRGRDQRITVTARRLSHGQFPGFVVHAFHKIVGIRGL